MTPRVMAFVTVGAGGFMLQLSALALLTMTVGWPYEPATAVAVELAVLHNFWWHERWTWSDRPVSRVDAVQRLLKYHLTTGITSIGGNVLLTAASVELLGVHVVAANVAAVAMMAAANYMVADRWVFAQKPAISVVAVLLLIPWSVSAAELDPRTIAAWDRYVAAAETRFEQCLCETAELEGTTIDVPGGAIHHWRGSVLVQGTTVDRVLNALIHPGTPPPQEDVVEARVLSRGADTLRVYLKLTRHAIVTVTYDTEHDVAFHRLSPNLATSRSVATRIAEAGGGDRGFLWRLNSYWRYTQVGNGVRIDAESISLSRRVPLVVRPVAGPIVSRIARESMIRTLAALRRFLEERDQ